MDNVIGLISVLVNNDWDASFRYSIMKALPPMPDSRCRGYDD